MGIPISDPIFRRFFKFDSFQIWIELYSLDIVLADKSQHDIYYRVCWVDSDWSNFPGITQMPISLEANVQRLNAQETDEELMKRILVLLFRADFLARMLQGPPVNKPHSKGL